MRFVRITGPTRRALAAAAVVATGLATGAGAWVPASAATPAPARTRLAAPHLPGGSRLLGALSARTSLKLTLTLTSKDPGGLAAAAAAVSDPSSPGYRRYLSTSQFAARFGASSADIASVRSELKSAGIRSTHLAANGLSFSVLTTAAGAEGLFRTSLRSARLVNGRAAYTNVRPAVLPMGVSGVLGLDNMAVAHSESLRSHLETSLPVSACPASATRSSYAPAQLAAAYGLGGLYSAGFDGSGTTLALFELADYSNSDVSSFATCMGISNPSVSRVPVDGGASIGSGTVETTSDIDDVLAMAPSASIVSYEGPNSSSGIYDTYASIIQDNRAQVIATAWGICEPDNDLPTLRAENALFQEAALQGETVFAASGDSGSVDCYAPPMSTDTSLAVDDPSSQPYVTAVGGTSLTSVAPLSETAWNRNGGSGGGGISQAWTMPSWQTSVVSSQSSGNPCGATGLNKCRETPDVSASADPAYGYSVYCTAGDCNGRGWGQVGGTSMASPLWAAIAVLADEACPSGNRAGFINPILYGAARTALNDVTTGNNDLNGLHPGFYTAGVGYDMATGLGSPNATALALSLCAAAHSSTPTTTTSTTTTTVPTSPGGGGSTPTPTPTARSGYRFVASDGGVFDFGSAAFFGSAAGRVSSPVAGMAATPDNAGYWLVTAGGQVLNFGDALNYGSLNSLVHAPIVGMAATADGGGYWLVSSVGGVYSFGDAAYHGSAAGIPLAKPIVGMASDPATGGYWLVASDGGIFSYAAPFFGSAGAIHLAQPIVGMSALPDGSGYRFVASDGGIFDFGRAGFFGSAGAIRLAQPVVGMAPTPDGQGYWLVASDGGIFSYGDAAFLGSTGAIRLAKPIVGMGA